MQSASDSVATGFRRGPYSIVTGSQSSEIHVPCTLTNSATSSQPFTATRRVLSVRARVTPSIVFPSLYPMVIIPASHDHRVTERAAILVPEVPKLYHNLPNHFR